LNKYLHCAKIETEYTYITIGANKGSEKLLTKTLQRAIVYILAKYHHAVLLLKRNSEVRLSVQWKPRKGG